MVDLALSAFIFVHKVHAILGFFCYYMQEYNTCAIIA